MTKHKNLEKIALCPVDGCDYEGLSRSMHLHVRQSSGDGHGPHGDIPPHLDLNGLEKVGVKEVEMDYPDSRTEEETARLCPYCGHAFKGIRGVKIHLGQKAGKGVHPEDAPGAVEKEDCPIARVDEDMNVIELVEERDIMPSTKRRILTNADSVDLDTVMEFIEGLEERGYSDVADIAREGLL